MRHGIAILASTLGLLLTSGCGGDGVGKAWTSGPEEADVEMGPPVLLFEGSAATDQPAAKTVRFRNVGFGPAKLTDIAIANREGQAGRFVLVDVPSRKEIAPADEWTLEVRFEPGPYDVSGCDFFGLGHLTMTSLQGPVSIPLVQRGTCDEPLVWAPRQVRFPASEIGGHHARTVVLSNPSPAPVTVDGITLAPETATTYSIANVASVPRELKTGEELSFDVQYAPGAAVEDTGAVAVSVAGAGPVSIPLWGSADTQRPRCADGIPSPPDPVTAGSDYALTLATSRTEIFAGKTRAIQLHDALSPATADLLLTSGAFNDPACSVTYDPTTHSGGWGGEACTAGGDIALLYPIPASPDVVRWLKTIEEGDEVLVSGYVVSEINYDDGKIRTTEGRAYFLVATWVCDP